MIMKVKSLFTNWTTVTRKEMAAMLRKFRNSDCLYYHSKHHYQGLAMFDRYDFDCCLIS